MKNIYKVPDGKMIKITMEMEGDAIKAITINGDFFAYPEECIEVIEKALIGTKLEQLEATILSVIENNKFRIYGFDEKSLATAIRGCLDEA